jgi:hypothetical protein
MTKAQTQEKKGWIEKNEQEKHDLQLRVRNHEFSP